MSKELEPAATGKSGRRGNEIFWTHPTKSGIIVARAVSARTIKLDAERKPTPSHSEVSDISAEK